MTTSHCRHCGQPYPRETPETPVRCGACDHRQTITGAEPVLRAHGTAFECAACGVANVLAPTPGDSGPDGRRPQLRADGGGGE